MLFRARVDFDWHTQRGKPMRVGAGQLVDIYNRHDAERLRSLGHIIPTDLSHAAQARESSFEASGPGRTRRIGLWMTMTANYSGGRYYLTQYAWTLAKAGAEVWVKTNLRPNWADDFPACDRLHWIVGDTHPPKDLDVCVSDNKGKYLLEALEFRDMMCPTTPLVAFNFETPNWPRSMGFEALARNMAHDKTIDAARRVDLHLNCSAPGVEFLREWLEQPDARCVVLPPSFNATRDEQPVEVTDRPYAMWIDGAYPDRNIWHAVDSVLSVPTELDLVCVGHRSQLLPILPMQTDAHQFHILDRASDAIKFYLLRRAVALLVPTEFEGFGMLPAEALSVGTPCITYDIPVTRWAYGDRCEYAPRGNVSEFAKILREIVQEPRRAPDEATEWVRDTYSMDRMSERIDRIPYHAMTRPSVSVMMLAWWGESITQALDSVYDHVDQILVAAGPVAGMGSEPPDRCLDLLAEYDDPDGKLDVTREPVWPDKLAMARELHRKIEGNYLLILDTDEIWYGLDEWIEAKLVYGCPRWVHLWHDAEHYVHGVATGGRWGKPAPNGGSLGPHLRWCWWRPSYRWKTHVWPTTQAGVDLITRQTNVDAYGACPGPVIYHLGHAQPRGIMEAKHGLYARRDGATNAGMWTDWSGQTGVWGDGVIERVDWELPPLVQRAVGIDAEAGDVARSDGLIEAVGGGI